MSNIRDRFVTTFNEHLAVSIEAAIEKHVPALKIELDRGSNPLQFALIWAVGLECLTRLEFRVEHDITVPWSLLRDWMRAADITKDFDGTFEYGSRGALAGSTRSSARDRRRTSRRAGSPPSSGCSQPLPPVCRADSASRVARGYLSSAYAYPYRPARLPV